MAIEDEWKKWMIERHIPDVINTKCFLEAKISRIHGEEEGGRTYSIMFLASSQEKYNEYELKHAKNLQEEHAIRFKGKFASFRTLLTVIENFTV